MHKILLAATAALIISGTAGIAASCLYDGADPLAGMTLLEPERFLDLPDPDTTRATATLENHFVSQMMTDEIRSFSKSWCTLGIQTVVVEFEVPLEDDAIRSILTRAIYVWNSAEDPVGWQLDALGETSVCARGDDPFARPCP